ncbi:MAG: tRNA 2-thiouridine(34) synthase MnmA [Sedimentisphaerales bacterium]|nr:tRNA 2-thiouridine(34) synthase MnmA [Sedimentisphaerales bacterium]
MVVALSGGVDSSAAAALLLQDGYECTSVFLVTSDHGRHAQKEASDVARRLGIELHVLDVRPQFEHILDYFCDEYGRGRTPNPCVLCNRLIKFGRLWQFARETGAAFLATGHYARIAKHNGKPGLYEGADFAKDQSYALSMVDRDVLDHVLLPLGQRCKSEARDIARRLDLGTNEKEESQEICFVPDDAYAPFIEQRRPALAGEGQIVDGAGKVLGRHEGIHRYTIGQRRGLGVAMGEPYYVTRLDPTTNTVVLGPKPEVMHRTLTAAGVNWLTDRPLSSFSATVKVRYNSPGKPAVVTPAEDAARVEFDEPIAAITPGQLAVFYLSENDKRRVAGAGWIDKVGN